MNKYEIDSSLLEMLFPFKSSTINQVLRTLNIL